MFEHFPFVLRDGVNLSPTTGPLTTRPLGQPNPILPYLAIYVFYVLTLMQAPKTTLRTGIG